MPPSSPPRGRVLYTNNTIYKAPPWGGWRGLPFSNDNVALQPRMKSIGLVTRRAVPVSIDECKIIPFWKSYKIFFNEILP